MSDYANPADCADLIRAATPNEKWLAAQVDRIDPDHDDQGHDGAYTRALEKLALQLRDELGARKQTDSQPNTQGPSMQLTPLTLPVTLELCSKSKALLAFLRTLESDAAHAPIVKRETTITPPAMGDYWSGQGGRYICTLPALLGMPERHLIAGEGEAEDLTFGPRDDVPAATSQLDGAANTTALLATGKDHPAAQWARSYSADGHTDFFLPAKLDLVMAHICAPQIFKKSGWYWASTQISRNSAFVQDFEDGFSSWYGKGYEHRVRAFRVIPLDPLNT